MSGLAASEAAKAVSSTQAATSGETLPEAAQFILGALRSSGSNASAARYAALLKKWAKEGRPYKGRVFSTADVEAAIKAFSAEQKSRSSSSSSASPSTQQGAMTQEAPCDATCAQVVIKACTIKAKDWPPAAAASAAGQVATSLGSVPASNSLGSTNLLRSLYDLTELGSNDGGGDVAIAAADGAKLHAHRAVLSALSPVLACKFDGRFGTFSGEVNAREFAVATVRTAIRFAYLGDCTAPESELGALFALADFWQFGTLKAALLEHVASMKPIPALLTLATFDVDAVSPPELGNAIAACAATGFLLAAQALTPAPREPQPLAAQQGNKKIEEEWAQRVLVARNLWATRNAPIWQFAKELRNALGEWKPEDGTRVRSSWVEGEGPLAKPLEEFFVKTLLAGNTREEVRVIMSLRELLIPHSIALRVARRLVSMPGLVDETGHLQIWVDWVCDGSLGFAKLWASYCTIRTQYAQTAAAGGEGAPDPDGPPGGDAANPAGDAPAAVQLPRAVENAFAIVFSGCLECSESAARWAALLEHNTGAWPALDESLRLVARFIPRSQAALGNLTQSGVLRVLNYATGDLPTAAFRLRGPEFLNSILGIYRSSSGSSTGPFIREPESGSSSAVQKLVLRHSSRGAYDIVRDQLRYDRSNSICLDWTGVPDALLRAARFEWKIQRSSDEAEDIPLAVNLDSSTDPSNTVNQWYIYVAKTKKFHPCSELRVEKEAFAKDGASHFHKALLTWAHKRSSSQGCTASSLLKGLQPSLGGGNAARALTQLCNQAFEDCVAAGDVSPGSHQADLPSRSETEPVALKEAVPKAALEEQLQPRSTETSGMEVKNQSDQQTGCKGSAVASPSRASMRPQSTAEISVSKPGDLTKQLPQQQQQQQQQQQRQQAAEAAAAAAAATAATADAEVTKQRQLLQLQQQRQQRLQAAENRQKAAAEAAEAAENKRKQLKESMDEELAQVERARSDMESTSEAVDSKPPDVTNGRQGQQQQQQQQQLPMEVESARSPPSALPGIEDDLTALLDTFDAQDDKASNQEPPAKVRRVSSATADCQADAEDTDVQAGTRRVDVQNYLTAAPAQDVAALLRSLLASNPDVKALLSEELASK